MRRSSADRSPARRSPRSRVTGAGSLIAEVYQPDDRAGTIRTDGNAGVRNGASLHREPALVLHVLQIELRFHFDGAHAGGEGDFLFVFGDGLFAAIEDEQEAPVRRWLANDFAGVERGAALRFENRGLFQALEDSLQTLLIGGVGVVIGLLVVVIVRGSHGGDAFGEAADADDIVAGGGFRRWVLKRGANGQRAFPAYRDLIAHAAAVPAGV